MAHSGSSIRGSACSTRIAGRNRQRACSAALSADPSQATVLVSLRRSPTGVSRTTPSAMMMSSEIPVALKRRWERERERTDRRSARLDPSSMPPREDAPVAVIEDAILDLMGPLEGQSVLDLACGVGDLSLRLLMRGAIVTALDLSPGMIDIARQRVATFLPEARADFVAAPAEATGLADESFDWVVGKWALHHTDVAASSAEIERLLKIGGRAV